MSRDLEDVLREIGELSNIHADRKKLRANLREIRDHRLAYYNQSNEKELQAEFSDALFKILLLELDEEEEESIEIAELAYLGLGHIFRRPELPTPELYKRRLLLLHYFCDYLPIPSSKYFSPNIGRTTYYRREVWLSNVWRRCSCRICFIWKKMQPILSTEMNNYRTLATVSKQIRVYLRRKKPMQPYYTRFYTLT